MSRASTSKDYTGRTVDLSLFPQISSSDVPSAMGIGPQTRVISGPLKACQKFIAVLMTELGSDRVRPNMGTSLPAALKGGRIFISPGQIEQAFNVEAAIAVNYLDAVRKPGQPLDEIITEVRLRTYSSARRSLSLTADATMADGSTSPILLPVIWQ